MTNTKDIEKDRYGVVVTRLVDQDQLEPDDRDVPEYWEITLPEGSDIWTSSQCATYVLDEFHNSVAIGMLEDFSISVFNPRGEEIFEDFEEEVVLEHPVVAKLSP
jgi:hypothetical protein